MDQAAHPEVDTSRVSVARSYDAALGGKDNFAVDREALRRQMEVFPAAPLVAKANRRWLVRVVGYLADRAGMDQFLDLGSGLPTAENTHEVAQRYRKDATVVYVDHDPAVNAYGRALLENDETTFVATADLTEPDEVLALPEVRKLEFDRPLVLMQCGTLHHVSDEVGPERIMQRYVDALPSGSHVVLSHFWDPADGSGDAALAREYERVVTSEVQSGWWRSSERILAMLPGLELLEPGLVPLNDWWPAGPQLEPPHEGESLIAGCVARKP
jgi:hypothetical protein